MEGGGGGNSVTGNSSDSGSGGIIDVSTVSSNFNAPTPQPSGSGWMHGGEEDKRSSGKNACPQSVEKVWFTDTSTGVWLLEEDSGGCEIPDEFLDVSLESEEEQDCDENSNDEEYEGAGSRDNDKGNGGSSDAGKAAETARLCGWVPPQRCLIPLPESPAGLSEDEREGEEGGEGKVVDNGPLPESELQRQHERELEVLFGFKPPSTLSTKDEGAPVAEKNGEQKECKDGKTEGDVFYEENNGEMVVRNAPKPRSNSADSGVASISPHSSEGGDMEQRHSRNQTVILATSDERTHGQKVETSPDNPRGENRDSAQEPKPECGGNVERGEEGSGGVTSTPERSTQRACLQVSRLRTPSEKLQKCSVFSGSPVVCSELEELREASKMTVFPPVISASLSPPATSRDTRSQTFTITPPTTSSSNSPTRQSSSSSSHHSEKSNGSRDSSQSGSVSSVASSAASREGTNQHQKNKRKIEKKSTSSIVSRPACRGALGYKAGTGAPIVKVVKRPSSKLKSLLPASAVPSALPSQVKKPPETKRCTNPPELQNVPEAGAAMPPRKTSAPSITSNVKSSGLVQPGKKIPRRSLDITGPLKPVRNTFVKPANPNPIKEARIAAARPSSATNPATASNSASCAGVTTTPTRSRGPVKTKSNPSTPNNRLRGNFKQPISSTNAWPQLPSTSACNTTKPLSTGTVAPELPVDVASSNKLTGLNMSIVSCGSPSVQQSTPMKQLSHSRAAAGTVVKAANRTVTKDSSAAARRCGEVSGCSGGGVPNTPRSSIVSTPSRRVRPKFSLSSIDSSESGPAVRPPPLPAALGDTFTEGPSQAPVQSTPKSPRRNKRRSFIPTPSRQNESRDVAPLVYNSDSNPIGHQSTDGGDAGAAPAVGAGRRRTLVPNPRQRRPLLSRNRLTAGAGSGLEKRQPLRGQDGPLKPANAYKFSAGENSEPPVPTAKVVHSPVNKDDQPNIPHSAWSPLRRKPVAEGEACFQCTKRGYRN